MAVETKRAYEPPAAEDGGRYLVDRLWPRGVSREKLKIKDWLKDLAPSTELRRWFGHDPARWPEFKKRYEAELESAERQEIVERLARESREGRVTLVYAARDVEHN